MSETKSKTTRKVRWLVDVRITCDPPLWCRYGQHGTLAERLERLAKAYESWVKDFHDFIRDHRSQDPVLLNVERDIHDVCSACGCDWETDTEDDGPEYCVGCGAIVEKEQ